MSHEPDWESLGSIQFLLYQRVAENLNAALAAINLLDAPEAADAPPGFWRDRANDAVLRALQIENAWSSLIRNKLGEHFLPQHMLHFRAGELIRWLAVEIKCPETATSIGDDLILIGNRETLQEALLLLHSCAGTLGPHVRLAVQQTDSGMWFRIRYGLVKAAPPTLNALMDALAQAGNWRAETALFELRRAYDFLLMNGCALHYSINGESGELAFIIPAARPGSVRTQPAQPLLTDEDTTNRTGRAHADQQATPIVATNDKRGKPASAGS
jgi:hypothetical protein